MREKIERFANGKFEYQKKSISISEPGIQFAMTANSRYEGSFLISSNTASPVKGIVYTSSHHMELHGAGFYGKTARISYVFDSRGMWKEEKEQGEFCIVTDAGEYYLPFTVTIEEDPDYERDSYAYFVSADPISPMSITEEMIDEQTIEIIDDYSDEVMSQAEADRLVAMILKSKQPSEAQFTRLKGAYRKYGNKEMLGGICSILIKKNQTDSQAFYWYRRGVEEEVKITNLYEYFMQSVPKEYKVLLPKNLCMYFLYNNTLSNNQKAFLYANIIQYGDEDSAINKEYHKIIESFMLEQLLLRRISEDMAVIYKKFLVESILTIDFAEALADIMFIRKLSCRDRRIKQVQVLYEPLVQRITVPLRSGEAMIPVYTPSAKILLMDEQENCYSSSVPYTLDKLMDEKRYAGKCAELLHYHTGLHLYLCDGTSKHHVLSKENIETYKRVLKIDGFTDAYKQEVRQEIIQYYYDNQELDELDREFFVTETPVMAPLDRAKFVEILIARGMHEEAWNMVLKYGYSLVRTSALIKLLVRQIREAEYEQDDFLLKACLYVFSNHKYSESILEYLAGYYNGSLEIMNEIRKAGRAFEINVYDLEERILSQMLFTEQFLEDAFEIFEDCQKMSGNSLIINAYLSYLAHEDFVLGRVVPKQIFGYIEMGIAWEANLCDICKLAYLRYLSGLDELSEHQQIRGELLIKEYIQRRIRFGFMKELMRRFGKPYVLEDKVFLEHRTNPAHRVVLHYVMETPREKNYSYVTERLYSTVVGVFVKEFTMFYGDKLTYFITETCADGTETVLADHTICGDVEEELRTGTKYAAIYEMSRSLDQRNTAKLEEQLKEYDRTQYLVETLFGLK